MFVWCEGIQNPADLNSKSHPNLLKIINGDFWRHGPPAFTADTFPTSDMKIYARYSGGSFFFDDLGLTETDIHLTTCMQTESGGMVAGKLTSHAQRLGSARLADGVSDTKQLMLADQNEIEPAAQLGGAYSGDAPGTCKPVQDQPGLGTSPVS